MKSSIKKALTIAELTIAIVVIGIIAVLLLGTYNVKTEKAKIRSARVIFNNEIAVALADMHANGQLAKLQNQEFFNANLKNYIGVVDSYTNLNNAKADTNLFSATYTDESGNEFSMDDFDKANGQQIAYDKYKDKALTNWMRTTKGVSVAYSYDTNCNPTYQYSQDTSTTNNSYDYKAKNEALACITGFYDVNGVKGPNKIGEDIGFFTEFTKQCEDPKFIPGPDGKCPEDGSSSKICAMTDLNCSKDNKQLNPKTCGCTCRLSCAHPNTLNTENGKCECNCAVSPLQEVGCTLDGNKDNNKPNQHPNCQKTKDTCAPICELGAREKCEQGHELPNGKRTRGVWDPKTCTCDQCAPDDIPYIELITSEYCKPTCKSANDVRNIVERNTDESYSSRIEDVRKFVKKAINPSNNYMDYCFWCGNTNTEIDIDGDKIKFSTDGTKITNANKIPLTCALEEEDPPEPEPVYCTSTITEDEIKNGYIEETGVLCPGSDPCDCPKIPPDTVQNCIKPEIIEPECSSGNPVDCYSINRSVQCSSPCKCPYEYTKLCNTDIIDDKLREHLEKNKDSAMTNCDYNDEYKILTCTNDNKTKEIKYSYANTSTRCANNVDCYCDVIASASYCDIESSTTKAVNCTVPKVAPAGYDYWCKNNNSSDSPNDYCCTWQNIKCCGSPCYCPTDCDTKHTCIKDDAKKNELEYKDGKKIRQCYYPNPSKECPKNDQNCKCDINCTYICKEGDYQCVDYTTNTLCTGEDANEVYKYKKTLLDDKYEKTQSGTQCTCGYKDNNSKCPCKNVTPTRTIKYNKNNEQKDSYGNNVPNNNSAACTTNSSCKCNKFDPECKCSYTCWCNDTLNNDQRTKYNKGQLAVIYKKCKKNEDCKCSLYSVQCTEPKKDYGYFTAKFDTNMKYAERKNCPFKELVCNESALEKLVENLNTNSYSRFYSKDVSIALFKSEYFQFMGIGYMMKNNMKEIGNYKYRENEYGYTCNECPQIYEYMNSSDGHKFANFLYYLKLNNNYYNPGYVSSFFNNKDPDNNKDYIRPRYKADKNNCRILIDELAYTEPKYKKAHHNCVAIQPINSGGKFCRNYDINPKKPIKTDNYVVYKFAPLKNSELSSGQITNPNAYVWTVLKSSVPKEMRDSFIRNHSGAWDSKGAKDNYVIAMGQYGRSKSFAKNKIIKLRDMIVGMKVFRSREHDPLAINIDENNPKGNPISSGEKLRFGYKYKGKEPTNTTNETNATSEEESTESINASFINSLGNDKFEFEDVTWPDENRYRFIVKKKGINEDADEQHVGNMFSDAFSRYSDGFNQLGEEYDDDRDHLVSRVGTTKNEIADLYLWRRIDVNRYVPLSNYVFDIIVNTTGAESIDNVEGFTYNVQSQYRRLIPLQGYDLETIEQETCTTQHQTNTCSASGSEGGENGVSGSEGGENGVSGSEGTVYECVYKTITRPKQKEGVLQLVYKGAIIDNSEEAGGNKPRMETWEKLYPEEDDNIKIYKWYPLGHDGKSYVYKLSDNDVWYDENHNKMQTEIITPPKNIEFYYQADNYIDENGNEIEGQWFKIIIAKIVDIVFDVKTSDSSEMPEDSENSAENADESSTSAS